MLAEKLEFSNKVVDVTQDICKTIFNLHSDKDVIHMFGLTQAQMKEVITKIVDALPDSIFTQYSPQILDEVKYICAREYIFFQVQEKWNDPLYQKDLMHFIKIFSRDIQRRIKLQEALKTTLKEEK